MIRAAVRPHSPSGTVTFLFTDVEGSTRLLHELGAEGYAEALAEHRRLIRGACAAQGGVEVDTQGDAFFFAFPNASGAVSAASSMTEALAFGPIQVRVGLHTGTPLVTDEGYVGDDVHFAARVAATGHGGQVVLSKPTAELVELELTDLGEHRLKDIAEAVRSTSWGKDPFRHSRQSRTRSCRVLRAPSSGGIPSSPRCSPGSRVGPGSSLCRDREARGRRGSRSRRLRRW